MKATQNHIICASHIPTIEILTGDVNVVMILAPNPFPFQLQWPTSAEMDDDGEQFVGLQRKKYNLAAWTAKLIKLPPSFCGK